MDRLPKGERSVFEAAVKAHPNAVERSMLDEITGYKRSSRDAYISRLQARRLLMTGSGPINASADLF